MINRDFDQAMFILTSRRLLCKWKRYNQIHNSASASQRQKQFFVEKGTGQKWSNKYVYAYLSTWQWTAFETWVIGSSQLIDEFI